MDIEDRCCWRKCRQDSSVIFMGAGVCDEHWRMAAEVYLPTMDYLLPRVVPEARSAIEQQHARNEADSRKRD